MIAKKSLGQYWLNDALSLNEIITTAEIKKTDKILEIGPGQGALTRELLKTGASVTVIEIDKKLAKKLSVKYMCESNFEIVNDDFLHWDLNNLSANYKVVANIPYFLTGKIIRKLIDANNPPILITLLVQREVASRIAAKPGNMSVLSVIVQHNYKVNLGRTIKAKLFRPKPKVDSQIVRMKKLVDKRYVDNSFFYRLVKIGFSNKRKKLINNLFAGMQIPKEISEQIFARINLNVDIRAQQLSLENWYNLTDALNKDMV